MDLPHGRCETRADASSRSEGENGDHDGGGDRGEGRRGGDRGRDESDVEVR